MSDNEATAKDVEKETVTGNQETAIENVIPELVENLAVAKSVANEIYAYLNSRPRKEVNDLCVKLEQIPTVKSFLDMVDNHYKKQTKE